VSEYTVTEHEYIRTTNMVKVTAAINLIRDCLAGDDYLLSKDDRSNVLSILSKAQADMIDSVELEESN